MGLKRGFTSIVAQYRATSLLIMVLDVNCINIVAKRDIVWLPESRAPIL